MRRLFSVVGFVVTLLVWRFVLRVQVSHDILVSLAWGLPVLVLPLIFLARLLLDRKPTPARAASVSSALHFLIMTLLGSALIASGRFGIMHTLSMQLPAILTAALIYLSGAFLLLTVVNLAVRGLGAPFAISLSKRLATDWLYAHTRNPMVLALLLFLLSLGMKWESPAFFIWTVVLFLPVMITYLKAYEERELEIRFGKEYFDYRMRTPLLIPYPVRKPLPPPVNYKA
jgi:protein-S-isoprenylcysteine O-methyltransferase Ste14